MENPLLSGNDVFCSACKHLSSIRKGDVAPRGIVGSVFGAETRDLNSVSDLQDLSGDTAPLQHARRTAGKSPCRDFPAGIFDVNVKPDVRILPLHFLDHTSYIDGLGF